MHVTAIRSEETQDLNCLAAIHAASWRSAYRGMLRDDFLDGDLVSNRQSLWAKRLFPLSSLNFGYLAFIGNKAAGFCFGFGSADPRWGTQLDNLHVLPECKGQGLGRALLSAFAGAAQDRHPQEGLYLWVYEGNRNARGFYESLGARPAEQATIEAPGGGQVVEWRYVWHSPKELLESLRAGSA